MTTPGSVATVVTAPRVPAPGGLRDIGHRLVGVTTPSMWFRVGAYVLAAAVLLHGWYVSDASFFTTEVPQYALLEHFFGVHRGTTRVLVVAGIMLAPPLGNGAALGRRAPWSPSCGWPMTRGTPRRQATLAY